MENSETQDFNIRADDFSAETDFITETEDFNVHTNNIHTETEDFNVGSPNIPARNSISDNDEEVDDEELITAQKVLEFLETAMINEKCAPEILPHQTEMLDLMLGQLVHMEENMKDLDKNDFRFVIHQMEIERIRYIIASYLRCRLKKIETYTRHILNEEEKRDENEKRLSAEETIFAKEYMEMVDEHFQEVALQYMPNPQRSEVEQRIIRPNLMSHVFIKANVSVPAVVVGADDEEVDLAAGSQHIIPYQLIADLIQKNQAQLI